MGTFMQLLKVTTVEHIPQMSPKCLINIEFYIFYDFILKNNGIIGLSYKKEIRPLQIDKLVLS